MAIPRGAPNVNIAARCAMELIEHAQVEQVCGFASPRHTFVEVFGLDHNATCVAHSFPETRKDFLVEDLQWLYQRGVELFLSTDLEIWRVRITRARSKTHKVPTWAPRQGQRSPE